MTPQTEAVLQAALALPETERLLLVERLMETLPPECDEVTEEEFIAELDRRRAEMERDPSVGIPLSDVLKEE
jgi:putative addiction module component (TIGR02574 family)